MVIKYLISFSFCIWVTFFIIGLLISEPHQSDTSNEDNMRENKLQSNLNALEIIANNLIAFLIMVLGAFSLGLITLIVLVNNSIFLGIAVGSLLKNNTSIENVIALLLPHGVFELPAMWLASAAGLKGPQVFIRYLRGGKFVTKQDIKEFLILSLTSIILIIIAGIIEATVTYEIAKNLKLY